MKEEDGETISQDTLHTSTKVKSNLWNGYRKIIQSRRRDHIAQNTRVRYFNKLWLIIIRWLNSTRHVKAIEIALEVFLNRYIEVVEMGFKEIVHFYRLPLLADNATSELLRWVRLLYFIYLVVITNVYQGFSITSKCILEVLYLLKFCRFKQRFLMRL